MTKDGTAPDNYCAIGDMDPQWCAHCKDKRDGLSGAERASRDKSLPNPLASIGHRSLRSTRDDSGADRPMVQKTWIWYEH